MGLLRELQHDASEGDAERSGSGERWRAATCPPARYHTHGFLWREGRVTRACVSVFPHRRAKEGQPAGSEREYGADQRGYVDQRAVSPLGQAGPPGTGGLQRGQRPDAAVGGDEEERPGETRENGGLDGDERDQQPEAPTPQPDDQRDGGGWQRLCREQQPDIGHLVDAMQRRRRGLSLVHVRLCTGGADPDGCGAAPRPLQGHPQRRQPAASAPRRNAQAVSGTTQAAPTASRSAGGYFRKSSSGAAQPIATMTAGVRDGHPVDVLKVTLPPARSRH